MSRKEKRVSIAFIVSSGRESVEEPVFKKYTGVGAYKVLAINPSIATLQKLYPNRAEMTEPDYLLPERGDKPNGCRIDIYLESIPEKNNGATFISKVSYFLSNTPMQSKNEMKVQIIDKFGDTCWISKEDLKKGNLPPTISSQGLRMAYQGEENLTKFLRAMLNIPKRGYFKDGTYTVTVKDENNAVCQLDHIADYFKGDFKELHDIIKSAANLKLKLLTGVRTTLDNKQYMEFYIACPMPYSQQNYSYMHTMLMKDKERGVLDKSYFGDPPYDFQEYVVTPTPDTEVNKVEDEDDLPFEMNSPWNIK